MCLNSTKIRETPVFANGKKRFLLQHIIEHSQLKKIIDFVSFRIQNAKKNQHNFEEILAIHILIFDLTLQVLSQTFIKTYLNNNFLLVL